MNTDKLKYYYYHCSLGQRNFDHNNQLNSVNDDHIKRFCLFTCYVGTSAKVKVLKVKRVFSDQSKSGVHETCDVTQVQVLEVEGSRRGRGYTPEGSRGRTGLARFAVDGGDQLTT